MRGLLLGLLLAIPAAWAAGDAQRRDAQRCDAQGGGVRIGAMRNDARWVEVGGHIRSWHSSPERCASWADGWDGPGYYYRRCRDQTHGLLVRWGGDGRWSWTAGTYRNSIDRPTVYVGAVRELARRGPLGIEVAAVAATGYRYRVVPLVAPTLRVELGRGWAVSLLAMPRAGKVSETAVAHVTVSRRFGGE